MNTPNPAPGMPAPVTAGAAPVWTSNVQVSLAVAFITGVAAIFPKTAIVAKFGLADTANVTGYVNLSLMGASLLSILGASVFRYFSKFAPQVLSWRAAMEHPATQAAIKTEVAMAKAAIPPATLTQARIEAGQAATAAHASSDSLNYINPDIVTLIAKASAIATVTELRAQQAQARAAKDSTVASPLVPSSQETKP
jgi:hypothetical protein